MAITPFIAVIKYITSQEDFRAAVLFPRPKWYPTRTPDTVQHVADKVPLHGIVTVDNADEDAIDSWPRRPTSTVCAWEATG